MGILPKKEICPICGRTIKGDVRLKIKDNIELCKVCSSEVEMDSAMIPNQTVEDIKKHLAYREENRSKMEEFKSSFGAEAGAWVFRADETMRMWYCSNDRSDHNPPLFYFEDLKSAEYLEDGEPAQEIKTGLKSLLFPERTAPTLVQSMKIVINVDNPYIHKIAAETLSPGTGMTTGTMQYKMNRKSIQNMMNCLLKVLNYPAIDEEEPEPDASGGQDPFAVPASEQSSDADAGSDQ